MASDTSLVFNLIAKDKISQTVGGIEGKFKKLATVVGGAAIAVGGFLLKTGMDWDEAFNTIRVGTGATGKQLEGLKGTLKDVMSVNPAGMQDTAQVLADLNTTTGFTDDSLRDLTDTVLNLNRITGSTLTGIDVGQTLNAWKIGADGATESMDWMYKVSQSTGIGVDDLNKQLQTSAPAAQAAGFSYKDTAVILGQLDKNGIDGSKAVGSLSRAVSNLAKDGEAPTQTLSRLNDEIKNGEDDTAALALACDLYGTRNGPAMFKAIRDGSFDVEELSKQLNGSEESIKKASDETMTFKDKLNVMKNQGLIAIEPAATAVVDALKGIMEWLKPVGQWLADNPAVMMIAATVLGILAGAILVAAGAMFVMNSALLMSPITWIVLGIIALVAIIVVIATKTTWFQTIWDTVWGAIKTAWDTVWGALKTGFNAVVDFFTKTIPDAAGTVKDKIVGAWNAIKSGVKAAWDWIRNNVLNPIKNFFTQTIPGAARTVKDKVVGAWTTIKDKIRSMVQNATQFVKDKFNSVVGFIKDLPGRISRAASGMFNGIKNAFRNAINFIIRGWNNLSFSVSLPKIPGWVPGIGGKGGGKISVSTPNIPLLAKGGVAAFGGAAIVGDAGPEVIDMPKGARVTPLSRAKGSLGGGGQVTIKFEKGGDPVMDALLDLVRDKIRIEYGGDVQAALGR